MRKRRCGMEIYSGIDNLPLHLLEQASRQTEPPINDGFVTGREAEERFLEICIRYYKLREFPDWVEGFLRATQQQDGQGIDFLVKLPQPFEPMPVQIKSSDEGKRRFRRKRRFLHIPCIVVARHMKDEEVFRLTLSEISFTWDAMVRAHRAKHFYLEIGFSMAAE